jgi:hypothetical protein
MKKNYSLLIAMALITSTFAQLQNTRWQTILEINGSVSTILDCRKHTVLLYTVADSSMIEKMIYTRDDTTFTLVK